MEVAGKEVKVKEITCRFNPRKTHYAFVSSSAKKANNMQYSYSAKSLNNVYYRPLGGSKMDNSMMKMSNLKISNSGSDKYACCGQNTSGCWYNRKNRSNNATVDVRNQTRNKFSFSIPALNRPGFMGTDTGEPFYHSTFKRTPLQFCSVTQQDVCTQTDDSDDSESTDLDTIISSSKTEPKKEPKRAGSRTRKGPYQVKGQTCSNLELEQIIKPSFEKFISELLLATTGTSGKAAQTCTKGESVQQCAKGESVQQCAKGESVQQCAKGESVQQCTKGESVQPSRQDLCRRCMLSEDCLPSCRSSDAGDDYRSVFRRATNKSSGNLQPTKKNSTDPLAEKNYEAIITCARNEDDVETGSNFESKFTATESRDKMTIMQDILQLLKSSLEQQTSGERLRDLQQPVK